MGLSRGNQRGRFRKPTKPRDSPSAIFTPPWESRTLVRHIFSSSGRTLSLVSLSSVFSVPSVRNLFLIFRTNESEGIAPSRKEMGAYAAMLVRGYRGVTSGLTSEAHEVSRSPPFVFLPRDDVGVSRRREKKGRLRRDAALGNVPRKTKDMPN